MKHEKVNDSFDNDIETMLQALRDDHLPDRDPDAVVRGRTLFLLEAKKLKTTVTPRSVRRHNKWIERFPIVLPFRKEGVSMMTQIISAILIVTTLLGGAGAGTVLAAQSSMPDGVLYPVKTWSETARINLAASPETDVDLLLEFAGRRIDEMLYMTGAGEDIPEALIFQLQEHLELAAQLSAQTTDPLQTRQEVRQQLMIQQSLLDNAPESAQMVRTRVMLQEQIQQFDQSAIDEDRDPSDLNTVDPIESQEHDRLRTDQPDDAGNIEANGYQENQEPGGPNPNPDASGQQFNNSSPQRTKTPMPGQSGQQQGPKNDSPGQSN